MWEIFAYQNSDSLYGLMNAVAAMVGANTYRNALGMVLVCGFVVSALAYTFTPEKLIGWKWLASVMLVMSVLLVPKVTVGIVDKTGGSAEVFVDNVPFGLAVLASLTSTIGNSLTELEETAMQVIPGPAGIPDKLTYQQNGLMFGSRLVRETSRVVFQSPYFRTDLINFLHNCTMYDLASGHLSPDIFATSGDVWSLMDDPNPARFTNITDAAGVAIVMTCPQAYIRLSAKMPVEIARVQGTLALRMNPTLPGPVAASLIADQVQQAYIKARIADASSTAANIIRQNALINAIGDTSLMTGQKINDPATMLLAVGRAQAVAQTNAGWINNGKVAEQALPVIRNVVEAVVYAMFPLMILLLLLANGKETVAGIKNYAMILIWIQLWPPLYAILNYTSMIFAMRDMAAAAGVGNGVNALSLATSSTIFSSAISGEAVVGYMTISIPFIAWAAVKRMENFGTALVDGMRTLQGNVTSSTNSASTGNVSMGNVGMDQVSLSPTRSSPFFSGRQNDVSGNTYTTNLASGLTAVKALSNEGPVSRSIEGKVTENHVATASRLTAAAKSQAVAATNEKASALSHALVQSTGTTTAKSKSNGTNRASTESFGMRTNELRQIANLIAKSTGATEQQVASVAFGGDTALSFGTPPIGIIPGIKIGISAKGAKQYSAEIDKRTSDIKNHLSSEDISKFNDWSNTVTNNTSLLNTVTDDQRSATENSERITRTVATSSRAEATLREQTEYAASLSAAYLRGESFHFDLAKDPHNNQLFESLLLNNKTSAAARIMIDSYLGSISKTPIVPTSASNFPDSFNAAKSNYEEMKRDLSAHSNIEKEPSEYFQMGVEDPGVYAKPARNGEKKESIVADITRSPSELQEKLDQKWEKTGEEIVQARQNSSNETGITENPSGHISSKKSLFSKANEQVKEDPDIVAEPIIQSTNKIFERFKNYIKNR